MNPTLWIVASAIGAAILIVLAFVYRRAAAQRELELAEELLDGAYDALEPRATRRDAHDEPA